MRFGAEVDGIGIIRVFDDFFLASSGFDGDRNDGHKRIMTLSDDEGATAGGVVEVFGTRFGERSLAANGWVGENLFAGIRIVAGEDDDMKIVWHAIMISGRTSITIS